MQHMFTSKFLIVLLLLLVSTFTVLADPGKSDHLIDPRIQKILAAIDKLGAYKFDACKTISGEAIKNCSAKEYVLWTAGMPRHIAPEQIEVGMTPAGKLAQRELDKLNIRWQQKLVVWDQISKAYALNLLKSQQLVRVYVNDENQLPRPASVFCRIELPTLLNSKNKPVIVIKTPVKKYIQYDIKRINKSKQWPCGDNQPKSISRKNIAKYHIKPTEEHEQHDTDDNFQKQVATVQLKSPRQQWRELFDSIKDDPVIKRFVDVDAEPTSHINHLFASYISFEHSGSQLAALDIKPISDNRFSVKASMPFAGRDLKFSGTLLLNPFAQNKELFARIDATLSAGDIKLGALHSKKAKLQLVIVNENNKKHILARLQPELKSNGRNIPTIINFGRPVSGKGVDFDFVFAESIKLTDVIPETKKFKIITHVALDAMHLHENQFQLASKISGKALNITLNTKNPELFDITGADLKVSDFVPQVKKTTFLNNIKFDELKHDVNEILVKAKLNNKSLEIQYQHANKDTITAKGEALKLTDVIPEAGGVTAFNAASLSLVSITPKIIEVDASLSKKQLKFIKTRGKTSTVEVDVNDLVVGDVFSAVKNVAALNVLAIEKIKLAKQYIELGVTLNNTKIDLVAHTGKANKSGYIAMVFDVLDAATFIPAAKGHVINEVELDRALFIFQPASAGNLILTSNDLPGDLAKISALGKTNLSIVPGLNLHAGLNVSHSKTLSAMFKTVGLKPDYQLLQGSLSSQTFKALAGKAGALSAADKQAILAGVKLSMNLPAPKLAAVAKLVKITSPVKLALNGQRSNSDFWQRLPHSITTQYPADGMDMAIQFDTQLTTLNMKEKLQAQIDLSGVGGSEKGLNLIVLSEGQWNKPFGIKYLTLKGGGFQFSLQKNKTGREQTGSEELAFFGVADMGKHKNVEVTADFAYQSKKGLTLNYFALDGKFSLRDIPGGNRIPHANQFELDELKITASGIEAKSVLAGKQVDAFLFAQVNDGETDNWTFAIDQKDFTFTELLPAVKKVKALAAIKLPRVAVIFSEKGIYGSYQDLPIVAQDMMRDIFGKAEVALNIPGGIGLLAAFDEKHLGLIGEGLKKIGVHDDAIIMGEITGIFQGNPGIMLSLMMQKPGNAKGIPKVLKVAKGAEPQFFIQWQGLELYVGAGLGFNVKAGRDHLHFVSKIELDLSEKGVGIDILGEMDGTWHKPFGIKPLSISDVKLKVGINDIGEVLFGFAGKDKIGKEEIDLATEIKLLLEAEGLPDGVAFSASISSLGIPALIEITEDLMGLKGQLSKIPMPFFEIHDALLAFATPGASDPQLGIVSAGFAFKGKFFFMNRRLGEMNGVGSPTQGITFSGDIADVDLKELKFKKNNIDIAINLHPKFIMNSTIALLGAEQIVKVDFSPPHFEFDLTEHLGHFGMADLRVRIDGFDLIHGKFDERADFSVIGEFQSTLVPWMEDEIKRGVSDLKKSADARLNANLAELKKAQARVDNLNKKIQDVRKQDNRARTRSTNQLNKAEQRVSSLKGDYEHAKRESVNCGNKWSHWACSGYWKVKAGSIYVLYKAAIDIVEAIKKTEAAAFDYDPRLVGLIAERDIEHAALSIAQGVVKAAKSANDFVLHELEIIIEKGLHNLPFEVDKAIIIGDLRDMIRHDDPLVLDMKFRMFGTPMHEYFALKVKDPAFDAVSFSLLPAIALDKLTEKALQKADPKIAKWIHSHIAAKLLLAEAAVRKQVQAEEKKYASILKSFENGSTKFRNAFAEHTDDHLAIVSKTQISDLFGSSKTFNSIYLAIGHSKLCLGVASNGTDVIQEDCKDREADRWSTTAIDEGYVQLKNGSLCLKARQLTQSDYNPLTLSRCNKNDSHGQWKIISTDGYYDKIVNRYSQKCLHFNSENANPKTATAVWTSCFGADSQTFRDITDAEKPTWHAVNAMLKAKSGTCLSVAGGQQSTLQPVMLQKHIALGNLTRPQYHELKRRGDNKLYAETCDSEDDRFNYVEEVNGDIKLVHVRSGWCVHPQPGHNNSLVLAPCDRGNDMLWRLSRVAGSAWLMRNVHNKKCLTLPAMQSEHRQHQQAYTDVCQRKNSQKFDFIQ